MEVIFKWFKYPACTPLYEEDDLYSLPLIVIDADGDVWDNVRQRRRDGEFVTNPYGYDHDSTEVEKVVMFGYLHKLKPVKIKDV